MESNDLYLEVSDPFCVASGEKKKAEEADTRTKEQHRTIRPWERVVAQLFWTILFRNELPPVSPTEAERQH